MKRSDITELFPEATPEQIQKIMDLNGSDINSAKSGQAELQRQLNEAKEALTAAQAAAAKAVSAEDLKKATDRAAALETELNELKAGNQIRDIRDAVSKEKGLPANLLTGDTEEVCRAQADAILAFARPSGYPSVPDSGELPGSGGSSTRDQFAAWAGSALT